MQGPVVKIVLLLSFLLVSFLAWGCSHQGGDVVAEIHKNLQAPSGVTVGRYPATQLLFDDPVCMSQTVPFPFPFGFYECSYKKALAIGDKLTQEFALQDPTPLVEKRFVDDLTARVGAGNLRILPKAVEPEEPSTIGSPLVIDFKTFQLSFELLGTEYGEPNNAPMHLWFAVRSHITQVSEGRTLWAEVCFYRTNDRGEGPYQHGELLADNGAKMKQIIEHAAEVCGKELAAKLLSP